jgi:hypothetical protein
MRSSRYFLVGALLVLLLAAGLRLWQLGTYPPGPHYDEAVYLTITRTIAFGGARPFPIVEAYQGREVLYMYLAAPLLALFGDDVFTLQVTSAFLNLLTVAGGLALGRAMFGGWRGQIIGLVIGAGLALSFPQIFLARQAFRAVTLPFCQTLALLFLWRGLSLRRGGWGWLLAGGLFAGLALYTYMASRLFPLWLLLGGLALLLLDAEARWRRLRQGALFFGVLALVALPMGLYALEKTDIFLGRLDEVTASDDALTLGESIGVHARMFFIEGEPYLRYNSPGRPYLTPLEGGLLLLGAGVALWRLVGGIRRAEFSAAERAACFLALLSPLMILPSVISVGGLPPNHMRSVGMIPLLFVMVGVGVEGLWRRFGGGMSFRFLGMFVAVVLLGGGGGGRTYFEWAGRADLYYETHADLSAAADWLNATAEPETLIYIGTPDREHPTLTSAQTPPLRWLGTGTLFLPPAGRGALYVFPHSSPPPGDWLPLLDPITEGLPIAPDERPAFLAYRSRTPDPLRPAAYAAPESAPSNSWLRFGALSPVSIAAGERKRIMLSWQIDAAPAAPDLRPLVQLEDPYGNVLYRGDIYLDASDRWLPGETLLLRVPITVPAGTPPGDYPLRVAWAERASDRYAPFAGGQVWLPVGNIRVTRPDELPDSLPVPVPRAAAAAPGVSLLGWGGLPEQVRPGESLPLTLFWRADAAAPAHFSLTLSLLADDDRQIRLWAGEPIDGRYPPNQWTADELLTDRLRADLPRDLPSGTYALVLQTDMLHVEMGQIRVEGLPRLFEPPPTAERLAVPLGAAFTLVGYTLDAAADSLRLELVWQSRAVVERDYTVFIHAVDASGSIIAQRDVTPRDGSYPTSLWLPGEYIVDTHIFTDLPAEACIFQVGLYWQGDGARLPVGQSANILTKDYVSIHGCNG